MHPAPSRTAAHRLSCSTTTGHRIGGRPWAGLPFISLTRRTSWVEEYLRFPSRPAPVAQVVRDARMARVTTTPNVAKANAGVNSQTPPPPMFAPITPAVITR